MPRNKQAVLFLVLFIMLSLSCANPITNYFSTQTAAGQTATATLWTPTPTFTLTTTSTPTPTSTPTGTPTPTPTPTPTLTPTPKILYADNFDDPNSGWTANNTAYGIRGYLDGGYRILAKQANIAVTTPIPGKRYFSDIRIEVDATKHGGPEANHFGVLCRIHTELNPNGMTASTNFYGLEISSAGTAWIFKYQNGRPKGLSSDSFKKTDGINPGTELNRIVAICNGATLELYANGALVASASDSEWIGGEVALVAGNMPAVTGADILFDNLIVQSAE